MLTEVACNFNFRKEHRQLLPSPCILLTLWVIVILADIQRYEKQERKGPRCSSLTRDPVQKLCCFNESEFGAKCDQRVELKLGALGRGCRGRGVGFLALLVRWCGGFVHLQVQKESACKEGGSWITHSSGVPAPGNDSSGSFPVLRISWVRISDTVSEPINHLNGQVQGQSQKYKPMGIIPLSFSVGSD